MIDGVGPLLDLILWLAGAVLVAATVLSAVQTLAVPRATPVFITRWVFVVVGVLLAPADLLPDERRRERVRALYAPLSLLVLPLVWLTLVLLGFAAIYRATGQSWSDAVLESGSSLLTLGFREPADLPTAVLAFLEAVFGLALLALLVSYLPSIYGSFSRREVMVTGLGTRAGDPPSATELVARQARIEGLDDLDAFWDEWSRWFADIEETHCSAPSLVYFRSPQPERSWITAAGAVLDAAALVVSAVDSGRRPAAELCLRSGYLALRRIADFYLVPYDPDPSPDDPVSVTRVEFDEARRTLAAAGAPLRPDDDRAWRDFVGWRVNYDAVLLRLASLCRAPTAPWSGDRPLPFRRAPLIPRRRRRA